MRKRSWTIDQLKQAVASSQSIAQVLIKLGLRPKGGNYKQVAKYISENGLNTAHLLGKGWRRGKKFPGSFHKSLDQILTKDNDYQSHKLKKRLFSANLKPQHCEMCGWAQRTASGHLPLELDHINGNHRDNRLENLRVLCPNCHSLQPTHRGRKQK
jgi:hypothetical protein